jgi:putative nucleotidyltransferase with HDIG domain
MPFLYQKRRLFARLFFISPARPAPRRDDGAALLNPFAGPADNGFETGVGRPVPCGDAGASPAGVKEGRATMKSKIIRELSIVNRELWLVLSMLIILALVNFLVASDRMLLGLYTLPVIFSAYVYGRRHATLTAVASAGLVVLLAHLNPRLFDHQSSAPIAGEKWYDLGVWAGTLMIMAYAMGTLYERMTARVKELRETYHGVLMILRHFISKDKYTENHSYRVSVYAARIATYMGLGPERVEDVRSAALLHDIGKLEISRELLYKAARLTEEEFEEMKSHVEKGVHMLEPVGGSLRRIIPIILAHHDKFDGSGYHGTAGTGIPIEARIISVADVYDSLTSDRPYRKAMSPFEAKEIIARGAGRDFDPAVVDAFLAAFDSMEMEVPEVMV